MATRTDYLSGRRVSPSRGRRYGVIWWQVGYDYEGDLFLLEFLEYGVDVYGIIRGKRYCCSGNGRSNERSTTGFILECHGNDEWMLVPSDDSQRCPRKITIRTSYGSGTGARWMDGKDQTSRWRFTRWKLG